MIGSLFYCCCKPVRIATCFDLSTVDQPSCVVVLLLCFVDVVWVVRIHGVHVSYSIIYVATFINRNHFWTGRECFLGARALLRTRPGCTPNGLLWWLMGVME